MSEREKEYVEGLEHFLEFSNEDSVDVDGILEQFPRFAGEAFENLKSKGSGRVLDIGSGNGAKAIYLARRLGELGIAVVIDSLEPKAEQRERLARNYEGENRKFFGAVSGKTLAETPARGQYDLALAIHSLYEFPRDGEGDILSLDSLGDVVSRRGAGVIIVEHPEGDFQSMKREIYPALGKRPPVSQAVITKTLEKAGVPYKVGGRIEFKFELSAIIGAPPFGGASASDSEIGKAIAFLFSDSLDGGPLKESDYSMIGRWARKNARRDKEQSPYPPSLATASFGGFRPASKPAGLHLWTPDIAIWTFAHAS